MSHLRISPRYLGQMNLPKFCERCFWHESQLGFKLPFDRPMPGLLFHLDNFEKKIVQAHLASEGELPAWLDDLDCTSTVDFPRKLTMEFPELDITMVGMPDEVFRSHNGKLYLVDYKTARFKGEDDPFMPIYEAQLLGYTHLLEANKIGKVAKAALVYFHNGLGADGLNPLDLLTEEGFNVPFEVKIHEIEIDRPALAPLLQQIRELADKKNPPKGRDKCRDCAILQKLFDDEVLRRGAEDYERNRDSLARIYSRELQAEREAAKSGWPKAEEIDEFYMVDDQDVEFSPIY